MMIYFKNKFLNISENTKKNLFKFCTDFICALISRHFIGCPDISHDDRKCNK